jgi:hypothetical protein
MKQPANIFFLLMIVVCVAIRTVHSGWGIVGPVANANESVRFGIAANPSDCLSYSSWAQQARMGSWTFSDLYTTTPHRADYFNPFFLGVGWLARLFSGPPELVLNLSIFLSLAIFVYSLSAICGRLGFDKLTTLCVLCLCFGGGGVTWLRRIVELIGLQGPLRTIGPADTIFGYPDWFYAELFPLVTFNVSPFHSMSLALMSLVAALLIQYDDPSRRLSLSRVIALIVISTFLVGLRPYEPVVLLAAYAAYFCYSLLSESQASCVKRRLALLVCLVTGILPFLVYDYWLTRQPVWREFSQKGLDLFGGADWAGAFLVLWVLAIAGVATLGARAMRAPYALIVIWASICATILIVLHSGLTKLCGGCTIPLSILAGPAIAHLTERLGSRRQRAIAAAVIACLAFGSATVFVVRIAKSAPPRVSADLLAAIDAIRRDSTTSAPTILTDTTTAMYLPGLAGFRVYCGNRGLTDDYAPKVMALAAMGLCEAAPVNRPSDPSSQGESDESESKAVFQLRDQIKRNVFSYILIDRRFAVPALQKLDITINRELPKSVIYNGKTFFAIKLDQKAIDKIPSLMGFTSAWWQGDQIPSGKSVNNCRGQNVTSHLVLTGRRGVTLRKSVHDRLRA